MFGRGVWMACSLAIVVLFFAHIQPTEQLPEVITIGGLFDKGDIKQEVAFRYAIDRVNEENGLGGRTRLRPIIEKIPAQNSFHASQRVCSLVRNGISAIFGPQSARTSDHVQSICDALEIPHIETRWDYRLRRDYYSVNLYPHPASLSKAYFDLIRLLEWKKFCVLYEDNEGILKLQELLNKRRRNEFKIYFHQLPRGSNYRATLNEIKVMNIFNILLDCQTERIFDVLKQAQQIGMMTEHHSYFITSMDTHLVDLEDFKYGGSNITSIRIIDPALPKVQNLMQDMQAGRVLYTNKLHEQDIILKTETALMYDAVRLFVRAIGELDASNDDRNNPMSCETENTWAKGNSLINFLKLETEEGLTGTIKFDSRGFRSEISLDVVRLTKHGLRRIGQWATNQRANFSYGQLSAIDDGSKELENKTLRVSMAFNEPYVMHAISAEKLTDNARFEGFCIDLLGEVAEQLKFNYILTPVEGNSYGSLNHATGKWNGMIKLLMEGKADLAMTDLTISYERQSAVDFTMPFMNLGISILYVKPRAVPPSLFSFLSPLSVDVWIYMVSAYVGVSVLLYVLARFSPYEWQNPHPCNSDPEILENQFTLRNCLWFAIGSLMQQGCDFLPQAVSTRMVAGMWWFFTLIMVSSYTANLAAFLTVEQMESPIESVEDLAKQEKVKYGTKESGTTRNFFSSSEFEIYQRMWAFMKNHEPTVFAASNRAGVDRVKQDNGLYAYFMESTSIEYVTERECELTSVGGLLDSKSYGLALPKGSPYKAALDVALLKLQSRGRFHILKNKWFRQKRGGGKCKEESGGGGGASELSLKNVGGVFVVLMSGMGLALAVAIIEFGLECWDISKEDGIPLKEVLNQELTFVFKCKGSSKPVRKKAESETADGDMYGSDDYNYTAKNPLT